MIYFIPSIIISIIAFLFIYKQKGLSIVQIFLLILVSYLNIFPAIDMIYNNEESLYYFAKYQFIIAVFFELPLLIILNLFLRNVETKSTLFKIEVNLNPLIPYILFINLVIFIFISWRYDLFFVRLGYADFQYTADNTPSLFLYLYRSTVETSFFVILFMTFCLRYTKLDIPHRNIYRACLISYLIVFTAFYAVNSRMQFLLLMLVLASTNPNFNLANFKRIAMIALSVVGVAILLTLAREFYIEQNDRLEADGTLALLQQTIGLIAARLNSVVMINRVAAYGFDPFGIDLSGLIHFLTFNLAFFNNAQLYAEIKASELTSPSVVIVNRILYINSVDFPKSMIVDVFLSFGVYGLSVLSLIIGYIIAKVQSNILPRNGFNFSFMLSLYLIPILFQFEKEFLGFLISCVKWAPLLILLYWYRPKGYLALQNINYRLAHGSI